MMVLRRWKALTTQTQTQTQSEADRTAQALSEASERLNNPLFQPSDTASHVDVSELSQALKRTVEDRFGYVRVRGEISGYRGPHSSGHVYFSLKDQSARIDAVIWKGVHGRMRFKPQEGLEIIATGKLAAWVG